MLKYTCQVILWKKKRNNTTLKSRDNLFELSWEIMFVSSIDMFNWYKTTASSGTFACKHVIENSEIENKSCKLVFEDKGQLWFYEWFFNILWQD